jgi:hypothetical protein
MQWQLAQPLDNSHKVRQQWLLELKPVEMHKA